MSDAVSRLLGKDDQPYVRTANELRDDDTPLTEQEKKFLLESYDSDGKKLSSIIDKGRKQLTEIAKSLNIGNSETKTFSK
jgi:hypothetical protein